MNISVAVDLGLVVVVDDTPAKENTIRGIDQVKDIKVRHQTRHIEKNTDDIIAPPASLSPWEIETLREIIRSWKK